MCIFCAPAPVLLNTFLLIYCSSHLSSGQHSGFRSWGRRNDMVTNASASRIPQPLYSTSSRNYQGPQQPRRPWPERWRNTSRSSAPTVNRLRSVAIMVGGSSTSDQAKYDASVMVPATDTSPRRLDPRLDDEHLWRRKGSMYYQSVGEVSYKDLINGLEDGSLWTKYTRDQVCLYLASAPQFTINQPGLVHEFLHDACQQTGMFPSTFVNLGNEALRPKLDFYAANSQLTSRYVSDFWATTTASSFARPSGNLTNTPQFDCIAVTEAAYDHLVTVHIAADRKETGRRNLALAESLFGIQAIRDKSATFLIYTVPDSVSPTPPPATSEIMTTTQPPERHMSHNRGAYETTTVHARSTTTTTPLGEFIPRGTLVVGGVFYDATQYYKRQDHLAHCTSNNSLLYASQSVHHGLGPDAQPSCAPMGNTWQSIMDQLNVRLETVICIQCLLWGKTKPTIQAAWVASKITARSSSLASTSSSFADLSSNYRRLEAWYRAHMHYAECQQHGLWKRGVGFVTFEFRRDRVNEATGSGAQFMLPYARLVSMKDPTTGNELVQRASPTGPPVDSLIQEMRDEHCFLTRDSQAMLSYLFKFTNSSFRVLSPENYQSLRDFFSTMTMAGVQCPGAAGNRGNAAWAGDLASLQCQVRQISDQLATVTDKLNIDTKADSAAAFQVMCTALAKHTETLETLVTALIQAKKTSSRLPELIPNEGNLVTTPLVPAAVEPKQSVSQLPAAGEPAQMQSSSSPTIQPPAIIHKQQESDQVKDSAMIVELFDKKVPKPKLVRKRKVVPRGRPKKQKTDNNYADPPDTEKVADPKNKVETTPLVTTTSTMGPQSLPAVAKKGTRKRGPPRAQASAAKKIVCEHGSKTRADNKDLCGSERRSRKTSGKLSESASSSSSSTSARLAMAPTFSLTNSYLDDRRHVPGFRVLPVQVNDNKTQSKLPTHSTDVFSEYDLKQHNQDAFAAETIAGQLSTGNDVVENMATAVGSSGNFEQVNPIEYRGINDYLPTCRSTRYAPQTPTPTFSFQSRFEDSRAVTDLLECSESNTQSDATAGWSAYCATQPQVFTSQYHESDVQHEGNTMQFDSFRNHYSESAASVLRSTQCNFQDDLGRGPEQCLFSGTSSTSYLQPITSDTIVPETPSLVDARPLSSIHPWLEGVALRVDDDEVMHLEDAAGSLAAAGGRYARRSCTVEPIDNRSVDPCLFVDSISCTADNVVMPPSVAAAAAGPDSITAETVSFHNVQLQPSTPSVIPTSSQDRTLLVSTSSCTSTAVLASNPAHKSVETMTALDNITVSDNENDGFLSDFEDHVDAQAVNMQTVGPEVSQEPMCTQSASYERAFEYQGNGKNNLYMLPPKPCGGHREDTMCSFSELPANRGYFDDVLVSLLTLPSSRPGVCRCSSNEKCTPICYYDYFIRKEITKGIRKRVRNALTREPFVHVHDNLQLWGPQKGNYFCSLLSTPTESADEPEKVKFLVATRCPFLVTLEHPQIWLHVICVPCGHRLPICVGCVASKVIPSACLEPDCGKSIDQLLVVSVGAQCGCSANLIYTSRPLTINAVEVTPAGGGLSQPSVATTVFVGGTIWTRNRPTLYLEHWRFTCGRELAACLPIIESAQLTNASDASVSDISQKLSTTTIESVMTWPLDQVSFNDKVIRCWASRCDPEYAKKKMEKVCSN